MPSSVDDLISADAPGWFRRALHTPFFDEHVEVEGSDIHYLAWGEPGRRGLVFVHGGGAHAHWWTHVAAPFARQYRVVALDLSGHGDSGWREKYSLETWAAEVMAVADDAGIEGPPVIIGHSMGGFVTIATAALHSDRLAGVIVLDSPVTEPDPEIGQAQAGQAFGQPKVYPTRAEALAHFRTVPPQEHYLDFVMHHVAARSVREVEGGWSWKFDHHLFSAFTGSIRTVALPYLHELRCRFALLRAEFGLVTPDIGEFMYQRLGRSAPVVELPEAGHHGMLDEPLVVSTAVRTLLADWDHSLPRRAAG
ncbi:MAG: alpha/beta hydrolase [Acidimicrobiales bacterium]|nr:alpha/beta hydrolase [Acidimicrobiales bacterium]